MRMNRATTWLSAALVSITSGAALAGPLDPPAGPIASTGKQLVELEPRIAISDANTPGDANSRYRISTPGSYYLTGNIQGVSGKSGIEIAASGVTLDLNGFIMTGVASSLEGIVGSSNLRSITIRNGTLKGWAANQINMNQSGSSGVDILDIKAVDGLASGIVIPTDSKAINCSVINNASIGLATASYAVLENCVATGNGNAGISCGTAAALHNCSASENGTNGIATGNGATVTGCHARFNQIGISVGASCVVTGCAVFSSTNLGIVAGSGSLILDCSCGFNDSDGIAIGSDCTARGNICLSNSVGIRCTGQRSRIEGNNCTSNSSTGIKVSFSGNIIIRNTCAANAANWDIVANNYYGPIINRVGTAAAAVTAGTNSAGSTLGSTDANANFSY